MGFHVYLKCFCFVLFVEIPLCKSVTIYEPDLLPPLELGSQSDVILNCDYDISEEEVGQLDLKWYFNDDVTPFLQWIPGGDRRPQLIEPTLFLGHVDLDYKIDKMDENKAYKALKIHDLTPNMAGNYCCKVSTFVDEGYIMQQLNIYVPPKRVTLDHHYDMLEQSLNFSCKVNQIFPKPIINVIWNQRNGSIWYKSQLSKEEYSIDSDEYELDGLYDINLYLQDIDVNEIQSSEILLGCEIKLPPPYDITYVEELQIELLESIPDYYEDETEEDTKPEETESDDDCLFCELGSGSEQITTDAFSEEIEDLSGDYDNDWLNIYNDSASGICEFDCDTASGEEDEDSTGTDFTADIPIEAYSPSRPLPAILELLVLSYGLKCILW